MPASCVERVDVDASRSLTSSAGLKESTEDAAVCGTGSSRSEGVELMSGKMKVSCDWVGNVGLRMSMPEISTVLSRMVSCECKARGVWRDAKDLAIGDMRLPPRGCSNLQEMADQSRSGHKVKH